jgi:hypothetical protein
MVANAPGQVAPAPEARSGLDPWTTAELPPPPTPRGLQWIGTVGPGVIVLGASIGSGEFLLGPAAFVRYGLTLLWVTLVAAFLQTVLNTELMRYTMATGEPVFTGFMRTKPRATFWAWVYAILYFLQVGWPGWAGAAAGAIYFLVAKRLAGPADAEVVYAIGVGTFLSCVLVLLIGRRIERTLEILNWILVVCIIGGFLLLCIVLVAPETWLAALAGFVGFSPTTGHFTFLPQGADFFLIGAFAAYSGAGGVINLTLSNWARDKGYGMGSVAGYIPAAVGGQHVHLAHTGFRFTPSADSLTRWRGWWRIVRADQWVIYFTGALLGMGLPALLYVSFVPAGSDIRGLGVAAALANAMLPHAGGALLAGGVALLGAWILFKTQLDILEGTVRVMTDIIWTGSRRVRAARNVDVRVIYYAVLGVVVVWGILALRITQPIVLLELGANMAGIVFIVASVHLLYVNTTLLPSEIRPAWWRRVALVATAVFYGAFVSLWLRSLL